MENTKNSVVIGRPDQWSKAASLSNYIAIARPDHWFKNVFVLPGTVIAALFADIPFSQFAWPMLIGLISTCLIASANYVIDEWLDAECDRHHPVKKQRPSANGDIKASLVYVEYGILSVAGLCLAAIVSTYFLATGVVFLIMGIVYNVRPFRTKDRVFLDVLSESINNPIRLSLGWFVVISNPLPPSSLVFGYWMGGAFLMAVKRYAELFAERFEDVVFFEEAEVHQNLADAPRTYLLQIEGFLNLVVVDAIHPAEDGAESAVLNHVTRSPLVVRFFGCVFAF